MSPIPCRVRPARRAIAVLAVATLVPGLVGAEPLVTMNQNPLVLPYGLPLPLPARLASDGAGRYGLVLNWSNTATVESSGRWEATVDAETVDLRLRGEVAFGERWSVMAELPWRSIGGGSLDGAIESWHDFWGLPEGDRKNMPQDRYLIEAQVDGQPVLLYDDDASGIADIPLRLGYQLLADERSAVSAWLSVDLPTGDADDLLGSGATDVVASVAAQSQVAERWQVFGQFDVAWLGDGDILPEYQNVPTSAKEFWAVSAHLGYQRGSLPVTEAAMVQVLSLPVYPELSPAQQDWVIQSIRDFYA